MACYASAGHGQKISSFSMPHCHGSHGLASTADAKRATADAHFA